MNRELLARAPGVRGILVSLYYLPDNSYTPYATWLSNTEEPENTFYGHYFQTKEKAEEDFEKRAFNRAPQLSNLLDALGAVGDERNKIYNSYFSKE